MLIVMLIDSISVLGLIWLRNKWCVTRINWYDDGSVQYGESLMANTTGTDLTYVLCSINNMGFSVMTWLHSDGNLGWLQYKLTDESRYNHSKLTGYLSPIVALLQPNSSFVLYWNLFFWAKIYSFTTEDNLFSFVIVYCEDSCRFFYL